MIQGKAQSEENGQVLFKGCNAGLDHLDRSLRASCEAFVRVVEAFDKRAEARRQWLAITCEPRLADKRFAAR